MSFLNPIMLAGLSAIAIPILIHLLNRRKFQKVVWAAMRFLQLSVEKNQRRMEIEDMILLVLRCLLVALIALALARPTLRDAVGAFLNGGKSVGVLLLDNSLSMGMSDGATTRFEKAKKAAEQAIDSLPSGSSVAVWLVSDTVRDAIPEPTFDLNLARKTIREAPLTDRGTDLGGAIDRAIELLKTRVGARREVYLFTDGQLTGWRNLLDIRSRLERSKDEVRAHFVFVSEHETRNLGIRDLRLASGLAPVGQATRFEVKVQNHGAQAVRDVRVTLGVDDEPVSDEFTLPQLSPGESKGVALFAKFRAEGIHAAHAQISEDRLPADNRRTIAVRAIQQLRILLVDGDPGDSSRASETFFLRHALNPVSADQLPGYFIKLQTITANDLAGASLDDYDVLILANVARFPERIVPNLASYVRRGGGIVVFPGDRIDDAFYNEQLSKRTSLLPAEFGPIRGKADQSEQFFPLQTRDFSHPITSLWNDPAAGTFASVRVFQYRLLVPASATNAPAAESPDAGVTQTVLSLADGAPILLERSFGLGRVVQCATTADTQWNDLPVRPAFVPLLHRILGSVVSRQDESLNLRVGARFARRVNPELLGKDASFTSPRRRETTRDLRRVEMVNNAPTLQYDHTDATGLYHAQISEPAFSIAFATQADPDESQVEELSAEQYQSLKTVAEVYQWGPGFSLRQIVERQRSGVEFWPAVITAALLLALCESLLGQWFSRSR
ncbi:MAG: BatA domain-containing protein [Verrucomicrobia bacterium]|nr:BatA domain-containing protein [Verrucomicrobiota bacterium]